MLDDAAYPAIVDMAHALGVPPRWVAAIFYLESRFDPSQYNPRGCGGRGCAGLSQIEWPELARRGIDPKAYSGWTASAQIGQVIKDWYLRATKWALHGKPARSVGALYAVNLAPGMLATKGDAPDVVLYSAPDPRYTGNRGLDANKDGAITVADLDAYIANLTNEAGYQRAAARLDAIEPPRESGGGGGGGGLGAVVVLGLFAAALAAKAAR